MVIADIIILDLSIPCSTIDILSWILFRSILDSINFFFLLTQMSSRIPSRQILGA